MTLLSYHLGSEKGSVKNNLIISIPSFTRDAPLKLSATSSERSALEWLLKNQGKGSSQERFCVPADRAFEVLKLLGTTGRVFYQGQKVFIDPFTSYAIYFEGERKSPEQAQFSGCYQLGSQSGKLEECTWLFIADPSWILHAGVIRSVTEEVSSRWMARAAAAGAFTLQGRALTEFLDQAEESIPIRWKSGETLTLVDPMPTLVLTDRHGGFADLWFNYGAYGTIAEHDPLLASWRNRASERGWEKDLLETDFIKKTVGTSHYYCPLDKVAKSLTFLLEIGWAVLDAAGRQVLRQGKRECDAEITENTIVVKAKVHYGEHLVDLKDLAGAFNRRQHFVELPQGTVALIDRDAFSAEWGDLAEQEICSEGIAIRKNHFGLLQPLLEMQNLHLKEDLRTKITKMARREPEGTALPGQDFRGTLFAYQQEGLEWLRFISEGKFGGLLADEMGLGKTVQVLAFLSQVLLEKPLLIVVPTSLLFNWQREIEKFLPSLAIYRHEGKQRLQNKEDLETKPLILTSYAYLRIDSALLQTIDYQMVILDEAQSIKNPESQIAQLCAHHLQADVRLAITGTPIENRLEDLWSIFCFLQPDLLGDLKQFQATLLSAQLNKCALERIKRKTRPFILRRKKEQVALQLPPKLEQTVYVEMAQEQRQTYDRWLQSTRQGLLKKVALDGASSHRMAILEAILRLRQLCAHPWLVEEPQLDAETQSTKFERLLSDLQEVVEERQKVLVYSQFTTMLKIMEKSIKSKGWGYVYLDGSTKDREAVVRTFQEDPETHIFLISLKAGGVGLNLTAADYVFLYDPWWNEAVERQAIDRAHRLGKVGTVIARRYITTLSVEEKIMRLKEHKTALSQSLLEAEEEGLAGVSLDDLLLLLDMS